MLVVFIVVVVAVFVVVVVVVDILAKEQGSAACRTRKQPPWLTKVCFCALIMELISCSLCLTSCYGSTFPNTGKKFQN